jgi:hypothetical protein
LNSRWSEINTRASIRELQHAQTHMWFQAANINVPFLVGSLGRNKSGNIALTFFAGE